jgi:hypothetical protein
MIAAFRAGLLAAQKEQQMNRIVSLCATALVLSAMLLALPCTVHAQGAQQDIDDGRAMVRAGFRGLIREEIPMTDQESTAFWPVYDEYERAVTAIMDRYSRLISQYVDRFDKGNLSDDYADELLSEYFAIRQELLDVRRASIPKFKAVLPSLKVARLYQLENKVNAEIDIQLALAIPLISE